MNANMPRVRLQLRIIQKTWADHSERMQTQLASRNAEARKIKDNHTVMAKKRQKLEAEMEADSEHCCSLSTSAWTLSRLSVTACATALPSDVHC
jgi:septal ring factor EnvC (AmiA/AmiB activator)